MRKLIFLAILIALALLLIKTEYDYQKAQEKIEALEANCQKENVMLIVPKDVYEKQIKVGDRIIRIVLPEGK